MRLALIALLLTGCATPERFLTAEQDEEMRANCQQGCAVIPSPVWMQIQIMLKRLQGV